MLKKLLERRRVDWGRESSGNSLEAEPERLVPPGFPGCQAGRDLVIAGSERH
jgi:hypothetical protein